MTHPGFATVQVRAELSLTELMALYWDALVNATGSALAATRIVEWNYSEYTEREQVKSRIREWLGWYGSRSVEVGPRNDYPEHAGFETALKVIVAKAYKIMY